MADMERISRNGRDEFNSSSDPARDTRLRINHSDNERIAGEFDVRQDFSQSAAGFLPDFFAGLQHIFNVLFFGDKYSTQIEYFSATAGQDGDPDSPDQNERLAALGDETPEEVTPSADELAPPTGRMG